MTTTTQTTKIFGIGLNKTGTTTLGECGKILGLQCSSCDRNLLEDYILRKDFSKIKDTAKKYDLFEDWPWPLLYKELDQSFPGSKFILTVRKSDEVWFESLKKHSLRTRPTSHCRKLAYGFNYPHNHKAEHIKFYNEHNERVREYFKDRPLDFIEICWERGDNFDELCHFLNMEHPKCPIPHSNKGSNNGPKFRAWVNRCLAALD